MSGINVIPESKTNLSFITNADTKKLKKRLIELINNSKELKFLVGFFYFSGIRELYESLMNRDDIEIKVLVGLDVDKQIHRLVEYAEDRDDLSDREKVERFFTSLSKSINSDNFDTQEFYEQVRFFIKLIKKDKLIIRKTCRPNHAKLYIFKIKEPISTVKKSIFITGSSNLTKSGLSTQEEFNVEISDYGTQEAEEYFDKLWNEPAVKITEDEEFKKKLIEIIETRTLIAEVTPFEAFILILKTYLDIQKQKEIKPSTINLLQKNGYKLYSYQLDAVKQALTIIENYDGVIIADVVGLGKSVIASMVAKDLGKRGVVICRPGLIGDPNKKNSGWQKYKKDFQLYEWEIRSAGKLDDILELVQNDSEIEVVIIDEAHNFRNMDTRDYDLLKNICRNKIVILLTATPFNNTPADIFALLKLIIIPAKSKITLDDNLDGRFREYNWSFKRLSFIQRYHNSTEKDKRARAITYYESLFGDKNIDLQKVRQRTKYISHRIRTVIEPILIRRNRLDLKKDPEYRKEVIDLSEIKNPEELFFELTEKQSEFYDRVINEYFGEGGTFKGAVYQPFMYESGLKNVTDEIELSEDTENVSKEEQNRERLIQRNLYDFMRRLLVKRFESSFGAFRKSLTNFYEITVIVQKFINKTGKYILDRKLLENIYESDLEEIEKELVKFAERVADNPEPNPKTDKIYVINNFKLKSDFLADIEKDRQLFKQIINELDTLNLVENDPKSKSLTTELRKILNEKPKPSELPRKIVVFTEYIDTATHLKHKLGKEFDKEIIAVEGDLSPAKVDDILENFDASYEPQKNQYQILIATDKISEGFNLNRAGVVINYDIPWNPTRVIQRVGRLNRISKKVFQEIYLYNFFPTVRGASVVKSREIAQDKMFMIHNTLGEDVKIFDPDETPTPSKLYTKIMQSPETLEEESFQTKIRQKYFAVKEQYPEIIGRVSSLSPRVKTAKPYHQNNLIVFIRKGLGFFVRGIIDDNNIEELSLETVYRHIECSREEKRLPLSNNFWENYIQIKDYKEHYRNRTTGQSVEQKALNNLKYLSNNPVKELTPYYPILRAIREDIFEYKTLSPNTLRRIANLKIHNAAAKDIENAKSELTKLRKELGGDDYLEKIKTKLGEFNPEIIIAVENVKGSSV